MSRDPRVISSPRRHDPRRPNRFGQVLSLFDRQRRWHLAGLLGCVIAMAVLETLGVASILPFMSLVADASVISETEWMAAAYERLGFRSTDQFLFWTGVGVLALITFSNAFTALTNWLLLRFTWTANHELSKQLLAQYLAQPYRFYLDRNTATLNKTLLAEVSVVITGVMIPGMRIIANGIVALCLLGLLFSVDPLLSTVVAVVLGGAYGLIYLMVRRRQAQMGRRRIVANGQRFQVAAEALGGIKDVKALGREAHFLNRFDTPSREFSMTSASNAIVSQLPRYALEAVAFGGILLVVLYFLRVRQDISQVLPIVSLYAFAGYRLMPALQQVFLGLTNVRFNAAALDRLYDDLVVRADTKRSSPPRPKRSRLGFQREIRFEDVVFRYAGASEPALDGIRLTVPRNHAVGLAGPTGSGKTTLVDLLLGLHEPDSGAVLVDGVPLTAETIDAWRPHIGYIPQHIFLCDDSITRNIAFGIPDEKIDRDAVERAARTAHLHDFISGLPAGYDTKVGERGVRLSGGQRQRIGIARALYHEPDVLVMDEATSALDGITESAVMQAIHDLAGQKTIILIAHRLTTVRACDTIVLLDGGRVVAQGTYERLSAESPVFRAMAIGAVPE